MKKNDEKSNARLQLEARLGEFGKHWLNEIWNVRIEASPMLAASAYAMCASLDVMDKANAALGADGFCLPDRYGRQHAHPAVRARDDAVKSALAALKVLLANGSEVDDGLTAFIEDVT